MENEPARKADVKATIDVAIEAAKLRLLERIEAIKTKLLTEFR